MDVDQSPEEKEFEESKCIQSATESSPTCMYVPPHLHVCMYPLTYMYVCMYHPNQDSAKVARPRWVLMGKCVADGSVWSPALNLHYSVCVYHCVYVRIMLHAQTCKLVCIYT